MSYFLIHLSENVEIDLPLTGTKHRLIQKMQNKPFLSENFTKSPISHFTKFSPISQKEIIIILCDTNAETNLCEISPKIKTTMYLN